MTVVTEVAQIPHCCGCGVGWQLQLQFDPIAWELLYAMGVAKKKVCTVLEFLLCCITMVVVQQDRQCPGSTGMQVQSLTWHSVLGIWCSCSCDIGHNCGSDQIPGLGNSLCHGAAGKKKKKSLYSLIYLNEQQFQDRNLPLFLSYLILFEDQENKAARLQHFLAQRRKIARIPYTGIRR